MKAAVIVAVSCSLMIAAFFLGRHSSPELQPSGEPASVDSLERALDDPDWVTRSYRLSAFLKDLSADNISAALSVIDVEGRRLSDDELKLLMFAWTRFDAPGAFNYALFSPEKDRRRAAGMAIFAWAFRDPVAATAAIFSLKGSPLGRFLEGRLLGGRIHAGDIGGVSRDLLSMEPGGTRRYMTEVVANELALRSSDALIEWAQSVIDSEDQRLARSAFSSSVAALSRIDAERAAGWVAGHVDKLYASGAARAVAAEWMRSDPESTIAWLAQLRAGNERLEALRASFGSWYELDPDRATSWLRGHTPNPALDPAVTIVASRTMVESPVDAIEWATRIEDKGKRERVLVRIGKIWMSSDPVATRRWVAASGLPPLARQAIVQASQ